MASQGHQWWYQHQYRDQSGLRTIFWRYNAQREREFFWFNETLRQYEPLDPQPFRHVDESNSVLATSGAWSHQQASNQLTPSSETRLNNSSGANRYAGSYPSNHRLSIRPYPGQPLATAEQIPIQGVAYRHYGTPGTCDPNPANMQLPYRPVGPSNTNPGRAVQPSVPVPSTWPHRPANSAPRHGYSEQDFNRVRPDFQRKFFKEGRVFATVWWEPAGSMDSTNNRNVVEASVASNYTGSTRAFVKVRIFIVWKRYRLYSLCIPIHTYGGRGTTASSVVNPIHHAQAYVGSIPPSLLPGEALSLQPIRIEIDKDYDKKFGFRSTSRINFSKIHTVEHNVKVLKVGSIEKESVFPLVDQYVEAAIRLSSHQASSSDEN